MAVSYTYLNKGNFVQLTHLPPAHMHTVTQVKYSVLISKPKGVICVSSNCSNVHVDRLIFYITVHIKRDMSKQIVVEYKMT